MIESAWVVNVGNELLIGRVVNTNASWLARRLTFLGVKVSRIIVVPDSVGDIAEVVGEGLKRVDLLVITGGLGPTPDDITCEAVSKALRRRWTLNQEAYQMVAEKYARRGYPMTPEREKMAYLPEGAIPIPNPVGTAPGVYLEHEGKIVVLLPGVPKEMESMWEEYVERLLAPRLPPRKFVERVIYVHGLPEADASPEISCVMRKYRTVYIKSHPKGHEVERPFIEVHVYASSEREEEAREVVERAVEELVERLKSKGGEVRL